MLRDITITVDLSSWPKGQVPPLSFRNLVNRTQINVLHALIHTALWTRPPRREGVGGWVNSQIFEAIRFTPTLTLSRLRRDQGGGNPRLGLIP